MGVETRRTPLPAPTDSPTEPFEPTTAESGTDVDLATDISRRTDKTSYTIPEDGGEITLPVKKRRERHERGSETRLAKSSNQSQTSLLIEYFEGGKDQGVRSRPSVRVKVTPSAARKIKNSNDHITVSESKDGRKPSFTRRISLGQHSPSSPRQITERASDDKSISSYTSAAEESSLAHRYPPVEIEVMGRDQSSDLSSLSERQDGRLIQQNPSEISSMPPDSMLEEQQSSVTPTKHRSRSTSVDAAATTIDTLKTPSRRRSRSLSKERIAHKAMEKLAASKSRDVDSGKHRRSSKTSRSRSVSSEQVESLQNPRRRSGKYQHDDLRSGTEASLVTDSQLSAKRQSGDQYSIRSGTSRSSAATNPQLLDAVEKAIRRLLPELEFVKRDQKLQKTKQRFEEGSVTSGGSDKMARKVSKHSSAPDLAGRPKVVLQADENDPGTVLSGDSIKGRKEHRRSRQSDSPSERRSQREMSEETVIHDGGSSGRKRSKEGHHLRDATAGGIAGGILTAAALNRHDMKHSDSKSSVDSRERRRRRRSKSHSRSASLAESEDVFKKHDVPPMPMQSDIHSSDVTRDSILSDETDRTTFEVQKAEVRHMARGSPREVSSGSRTPTKAKGEQLRKSSLGTHHSNLSQGDLSQGSPRSAPSPREESQTNKGEKSSIFGGGVAGSGAAFLAAREYSKRNSNGYDYSHEGRGLSPIQSVSSRQESEADRQSYRRNRSSTSLNEERQRRKSAASPKSETSVATGAFDRTTRPKGIHLEPGEDVLNQHQLHNEDYEEEGYSDQDPAVNEWLQREHEKNDEYRSTLGDENDGDATVDYRHMTNYTDDSMDAPRLSQVVEGQKHQNVDARKNPDYRGTPVAVESAVASLLETSVLSTRSKGDRSFIDSPDKEAPRNSAYSASREVASREQSPVAKEQRHSPTKSYLHDLSAKGSPRQSVARSEDERLEHGYNAVPTAGSPIPEIGANLSDSDISTNPSIIQGPMGGTPRGNRDHWPYHPTPPQANDTFTRSKDSSAHECLKAVAARHLSAAQVAKSAESSPDRKTRSGAVGPGKDEVTSNPSMEEGGYGAVDGDIETAHDSYMGRDRIPSPPKDEGYVSSGPQRGVQSPELAFKDATSFNDGGLDLSDDPFVGTSHTRHLSTNSGLARGMGSPLYDSATGNGIDRIQSKDIVALMDHLTVRDAQRNARDTEILITLVRSAAEMRNSFEDMKKFIAEQDDLLAEANRKEHDNAVQKITLGGPRPQPNSAPKSVGRSSREEDSEDTPNKRRNVFRRALQGLSSRNQNDVGKIEDMLHHLLAEVQDLKTGPDVRPSTGNTRAQTLNSYENLRATDPSTYEPQAQPGISSGGNSGYFSNPSSRGPSAMKSMGDRQGSQNRVSTVLEADEELDEHDQQILDNQFENNEEMLTPTKENPRPDSVPLATPPQAQLAAVAAKSIDNTPKTSAEKNRKHRSSNSSFFPKVSRWSRTTASSIGDNFRTGAAPRRERPPSEASRSGDLQQYETNDHYDHRGDDRIRSNDSLESPSRRRQRQQQQPYIQEPLESPEEEVEEAEEEQDRPPSPLVPSHLSASEDPKYQAHRNSLNLQHPQPRQGPTHRYQHALETKAKDYSGHSARSSPGLSPTSDSFGSDPTLSRFNMPGVRTSRYGAATGPGNLSPVVSDSGAYSDAGTAPPRPPKVKDDGPLVPQTVGPARPPKLATGPSSTRPKFASPLSRTEEEDVNRLSMASASDEVKGSPRPGKARRAPSGPRAMSGTHSRSSPRRTVSREKDASPVQSEDGAF